MSIDRHSEGAPPGRLLPAAILAALRCPLCRRPLDQDPTRLYCPDGHSFDRARQGYVTLGRGHRPVRNADSTAMVAARERLLASGLFEPIRRGAADLLADRLPGDEPFLIADLAGGTGYYLAGMLDRQPGAVGLCLDLSPAALRRAARCHPRAAAIGSDLRDRLPLATGSISAVASFFGPRPPAEIARVMTSHGVLLVVTPTVRHLAELVATMGMVSVDRRKDERLAASLSAFTRVRRTVLEFSGTIDRDRARALVAMGPSAHHLASDEIEERLGALAEAPAVTVSVNIDVYRKAPTAPPRVGADGFEPPTARV